MKLVRYNNFDNYAPTRWSSVLDSLFSDSNFNGSTEGNFTPNVDIIENEGSYEIHVAVPGMNKEDFSIDINDRKLIVSGERKQTEESKSLNYHRIESQYGSFKRAFTLPENIDKEKVSAAYTNGILEIGIPKDVTKALKTSIKVK